MYMDKIKSGEQQSSVQESKSHIIMKSENENKEVKAISSKQRPSFEIGLLGGYEYAFGNGCNDDVKSLAQVWKNLFAADASYKSMNNGYGGGIECKWHNSSAIFFGNDHVSIGVRAGYWKFNIAEANAALHSEYSYMVQDLSMRKYYETSFIPFLIGCKYYLCALKYLFIYSGIYTGVGHTEVVEGNTTKIRFYSRDTSYLYEDDLRASAIYSGYGFTYDAIIGTDYQITRYLWVGLEIYYRYFNVPVRSSGNYKMDIYYGDNIVHKGDYLINRDKKRILIDLNGLISQFKISYCF